MRESALDISWTRTVGSALGAVSSAVLLSTLGVAGTLIGAALGSLVITVGGAMYTSSLHATKERVVKVAARNGHTAPRARVDRDPGDVVDMPAQEHRSAPLPDGDDEPPSTSWGQTLRDLPWKRITGVAVAVFVVAMGLILAFELTTGRAVSSYTGGSSTGTGTSIPGVDGRGSGAGTEQDQQDPQQQDDAPQDPQQQEDPQQ